MDYLDFDIEIGPGAGREFPVKVLSSPAGEAHETFHFPYDELALESVLKSLQIALLRSGGERRRILHPEEQVVLEFGRTLFNSLFTGEVRSRYDVSQGEADRRGAGLRVKLRVQAPELAALPWEFLYDPREAEFICFSRNRPMVRYLDLPRPVKPLSVEPPLQVLGMIVSPDDLNPLDVDREKSRVERALKRFRAENLVNLTWLQGGTWRDLQRALQVGRWHIFHFIGHGGFDPKADEGLISLADSDGLAEFKTATQVGRLLADHHPMRLVILNACEGARGSEIDIFSSTAAILVRKGIPAVLAMQYEITDRAAIVFARGFYEALVNGIPVDAAVAEARKAISLAVNNTIEWGTPVLYLRAPDGKVFDLAKMDRPPRRREIPSDPASREMERRLEEDYIQANTAYWLEEWDTAANGFQSIVDRQPGYRDAEDKLAQARRQAELARLYHEAQAAQENSDWKTALDALERLVASDPEYEKAAEQLEEVRTRSQVEDLYQEAQGLAHNQKWGAVEKVLDRILEIEPAFPDPEDLGALAAREIAALERQNALEELHRGALEALDEGQWEQARERLEAIEELEPGFGGADTLLLRVEREITAAGESPVQPASDEGEIEPEKPPPPGIALQKESGMQEPGRTPSTSVPREAAKERPKWRDRLASAFAQGDWGIFRTWFGANAIGWAVALGLTSIISDPIYQLVSATPLNDTWFSQTLVLILWTSYMAIVWGTLRRRFPLSGWRWLIVTGAAWLIGVTVESSFHDIMAHEIGLGHGGWGWVSAILYGLLVGGAQQILLRGHLSLSGWWLAANGLAWLLAYSLIGDFSVAEGPGFYLFGALIGLITGVALALRTGASDPDHKSRP
jgi:tetratricopeptide (TPR) repeat protein